MPRSGVYIFSDFVGRTDHLTIACNRCDRRGRYALGPIIERHGLEAPVFHFIDEVTADCPMQKDAAVLDRCGAHCPTLAEVLLGRG